MSEGQVKESGPRVAGGDPGNETVGETDSQSSPSVRDEQGGDRAYVLYTDLVPSGLCAAAQWMGWGPDGKWPCDPRTGRRAEWSDRSLWMSFGDACALVEEGRMAGIGYILTEEDGFVSLDIDHCVRDGAVAPWAQRIVDLLGTYTEISPSGTGLRLIGRGKWHGTSHELRLLGGKVEVFDSGKYQRMTGNHLSGTPTETVEVQNALQALGLIAAEEEDARKWLDRALADVYQDGDRNETGFWLACQLRDERVSRGMAEACMRIFAETVRAIGDHPYTVDEALASLEQAYSRPPRAPAGGRSAKGPTQAERLLRYAGDARLVRSSEPNAPIYAVVGNDVWPLGSRKFRSWLLRRYVDREGGPPQPTALRSALDVIRARGDGDDVELADVGVRVLEHEGNVYLDLADADGHVVRITPQGWEVLTNPEVLLYRPPSTLPLPLPERGGDIDELWVLLNVAERRDQMLLAGWLVGALNPRGPHLILAHQGPQGSAKSVAARLARQVLDPVQAPLRALPKDEHDLMISALRQWILAFDNASRVPEQMSDALCRICTGSGFGTRTLYTDEEEHLFAGRRPVILNSIPDVLEREDARDRALIIELAPIGRDARLTESEVDARFDEMHPRVLGVLLDGAVAALRDRKWARQQLKGRLPRMSDHAVWVYAAASAFPWTGEDWLEAFDTSARAKTERLIAEDPVALAIISLFSGGKLPWKGTSTELLELLAGSTVVNRRPASDWPQSPRALSARLTRLKVALATVGIIVGRGQVGQDRYITVEVDEENPPTDWPYIGLPKLSHGLRHGEAHDGP